MYMHMHMCMCAHLSFSVGNLRGFTLHGDHGREIMTLCPPPKLPRSIRPRWNMRTCTLINTTQHIDIDQYYSVHPRPRNALGFLFRAS